MSIGLSTSKPKYTPETKLFLLSRFVASLHTITSAAQPLLTSRQVQRFQLLYGSSTLFCLLIDSTLLNLTTILYPQQPPPMKKALSTLISRSRPTESKSNTMGSPCKRGLCWPTDNHGKDEVLEFTKPGSKVSWLYNWSPRPTPNSSLQFVPMQWNHVNIDELHEHARSAGAPAILGFNEPELPDQSNMPVDLAAAEWLRCIEPLRQAGVRAGSPGISSAPHAVGWLQEFLAKIREGGSDIDFYCFHWYGVELGQFYDYIWSTYHQLGPNKPAWITEYACTNWSVEDPLPREHVENFARESAKYLDTLDWVERYAWFGPMRDCGTVGRWATMLDGEGGLTPLGRAYRDE